MLLKGLMTQEEAMAFLGVKKDTFYELRNSGLITTVYIGSKPMFPVEALDDLCHFLYLYSTSIVDGEADE